MRRAVLRLMSLCLGTAAFFSVPTRSQTECLPPSLSIWQPFSRRCRSNSLRFIRGQYDASLLLFLRGVGTPEGSGLLVCVGPLLTSPGGVGSWLGGLFRRGRDLG